MKKYLLIIIVSFSAVLRAGEYDDKGLISGWCFSPLQIDAGLVGNKKLFDESTNTFLSLGVFMLQQKSAVLSFATFANTLQNNYGLQLNTFFPGTLTDNNYGISLGFENFSKKCYGIQLGLVNHCFAGDKIEKQNERIQFLGVNIADFLFVGLVNFSNEIQIGLCNFSKSAVFQIGLINYNPCSYVPWMPLVNFNMGRKSGR